MNYLAHLLLAGDGPESLLGNLMGDFARGLDLASLRPGIRRGVLQHRRVDAWTDAHPLVRAGRARLWPQFGHYARVLVDVFYDHLLARDWERWSSEDLPDFARRVYDLLEARSVELSPALQRAAPRMAACDLLSSYRELDGVRWALRGIARRSRRAPDLEPALASFVRYEEEFEADFLCFFPELQAALRACGAQAVGRMVPPASADL